MLFDLAQVNVSRLLAPLDSPLLVDFMAALDEVNAAGDGAAGFLWRLQAEDGNATSVRAFGWDVRDSHGMIVNLTTWTSVQALADFVFCGEHLQVMRRRRTWFERAVEPTTALWWVPAGHRPSTDEAEARVRRLRQDGPSQGAFTFRTPFPSPDQPDGWSAPTTAGSARPELLVGTPSATVVVRDGPGRRGSARFGGPRRTPAPRPPRARRPPHGAYPRTVDLVVDDAGGRGVPVVCLPMLGMTRVATATAFGPALAGSPGLREVYPDLPGHGDSPGEGPADSQTVLDTLGRWLDSHLDGPALMAGASYGGYLAAGLARQRPDLVRGLLLVCPGVRTGAAERDLPDDEPPPGEPGWLSAAPADVRGHLDRALGHRTRGVVATVLEALAAGGPGDEQYQDALTEGAGYALPDQDGETRFLGPVAVVTGRQDRVVGYADQFRALRYPRATYSVLDRAGHYLPFEQPDLLRTLTGDWLRRALG